MSILTCAFVGGFSALHINRIYASLNAYLKFHAKKDKAKHILFEVIHPLF
jgi:hypothetical protein